MTNLAALQGNYLAVRGHTLSTDGLPFMDAMIGQAKYIHGEAAELRDAVDDLFAPEGLFNARHNWQMLSLVRHEIADVVLATVTLANILGVTVEACIAEKTEADRGRG